MIRRILLYLIPIALGIAVLITARQLDIRTLTVEEPPEKPTSGNAAQMEEPAESRETTPQQFLPGGVEPQETTAAKETVPQETEEQEEEPSADRILLSFAGNCTLGGNGVYEVAGNGFKSVVGDDYQYPFRNVVEFLKADDLTMLNLESPLTDRKRISMDTDIFRGMTDYTRILSENSVECVSLANDHSQDYGADGYASTQKALEAGNISMVERDAATVITLDSGVTVGIYGAVFYSMEEDVVARQIRALKDSGVDIVIFAPHWGSDTAYSQNKQQTELAHLAIDSGADIVYGTHPRRLQPIEEYNGGVIFYSLSDFCYGGNITPKDMDTAVIQQEFVRGQDGKLMLGQRTVIPCSISSVADYNNFQPTPYEEGTEAYSRVLRKLGIE